MKRPHASNLALALAVGLSIFSAPDSVRGDTYALTLEQTMDMAEWTPVEITPQMLDGEGRILLPGEGGSAFFRMSISGGPPTPAPEGFALIPAGTFTMGRTSGDTDPDAPPTENIYVSEFYMATHEVTWELWNDVRNWAVNNGYTDIATGGGKAANHPVHSVNWWDVVKWCNARSERDGLTTVYTHGGDVMRTGMPPGTEANWNANGYRLPTEAEWEKAARGGVSGQRYPWGTDLISHNEANYRSWGTDYGNQSGNTLYHPAYDTGSFPYTSPVGSFENGKNGYGLYDMAGNVSEWCWDGYWEYSYTAGASNPKGASGLNKVSRGGTWGVEPIDSRSAARKSIGADSSSIYWGFRLARSSVP